ncbi:MAG TPA: hypothetical protein PLD25_27110 [Chloroflexota bacterium]|nr:hypothetical protein [Chloroflexota bacterium]HUM67445.1 hypothetical protein [Chloroflexota bacterium]
MDGSNTTPSPQLLEANRRLYALRIQAQAQRQAAGLPADRVRQPESDLPWHEAAPQKPATTAEKIAALPDHLGWGSEALTAVLRRRRQESGCVDDDQGLSRAEPRETAGSNSIPTNNAQAAPSSNQQSLGSSSQTNSWVKLYPDIGLGMLRQELTAPGRLWLLLRYLDREGSGVLRIDILAQPLTKKSSPLHLCGKRQLRNLLQDGEGVYWIRDKEHIWLCSAAKVAYALGVERLTGRPVALPVAALLDGIGAFRAHLYTAFHSGRTKDTPYGEQAMPIARETMEQMSGVGRSSQRAYEERVGVEVQANFVVGDIATKENQENRAWVQGQALFELKDYRGQQGKKGKTYLAWQLPNTYLGQHRRRPRGRQKRINRKLNDLVMKGMPGNVGGTSETQKPEKVYYPNGKLAAKAYGRDPERELYWKRHRTGNGRFDLWQQLGGG